MLRIGRLFTGPLAAGTLYLSSTVVYAASACLDPASDPDGDGWGFENGQSCVVAPATQSTSSVGDGTDPHCIDTDPPGDGWGWNGSTACQIGSTSADSNNAASGAAECIDTDPVGDGWGWDGSTSCRVAAESPSESSNENSADSTDSAATCVDTDPPGDGWGWNGSTSCRVDATEQSSDAADDQQSDAECFDTDPVGDGWGWNGTTACRVNAAESVADESASVEAEAECFDTDPVGDGWGWNGSASCRVTAEASDLTPDQPADQSSSDSSDDTAECFDTDPVGDGWGWDGQMSCRIDVNNDSADQPESTNNGSSIWQNVSGNGTAPHARHEAGAVELNGRLYLLGGRGNRPVEEFDPATGRWRNLGYPPFEMHHFQPVALNGYIYVIGAFTCCYPQESIISQVWRYQPATNSWSSVGNMPASRQRGSAAAVVYNNRMYIVGGNTRGHMDGAVNWLDEYNPATGQWQQLASAPRARDHITAAVANGRLVVSAGRRSAYPNTWGNTVGATDIYDFATGQWSSAASIPTQRAGAMVVSTGSDVVVIGGESNSRGNAHNEVEIFNVQSRNWRSAASLLQGRHSGGAAVLNGAIHVVAGGANRGGGSELTSMERLANP